MPTNLHAHLLQHGHIRIADVPDTDRDALRALVKQRLAAMQYGPGLPRAVLTRRGRITLTESVNDVSTTCQRAPRPPDQWDF